MSKLVTDIIDYISSKRVGASAWKRDLSGGVYKATYYCVEPKKGSCLAAKRFNQLSTRSGTARRESTHDRSVRLPAESGIRG